MLKDFENFAKQNNFDEFHFIKDNDFFIEIYEDETSIYRIFLIKFYWHNIYFI